MAKTPAELVWDRATELSEQAKRWGQLTQHERLTEPVTTGKGNEITPSDELPWSEI